MSERAPGWTLRMAETEQRLVRTALGLFEEHGYDAVTIAAIAKAAGVGERTAYRYFPTKESFVIGDAAGEFDRFITLLHEAPTELSVIDAIRWAAAVLNLSDLDMPDEHRRTALLRITPSVHQAWTAALEATEPRLGAWLADRTGRDAASIEIRVATTALLAAHRMVVLAWDGTDADDYRHLTARALAVIDSGLSSL